MSNPIKFLLENSSSMAQVGDTVSFSFYSYAAMLEVFEAFQAFREMHPITKHPKDLNINDRFIQKIQQVTEIIIKKSELPILPPMIGKDGKTLWDEGQFPVTSNDIYLYFDVYDRAKILYQICQKAEVYKVERNQRA